ncbi:MAG: RNA methyltransferase [Ignavibacteriae bacterium HGW-Ignavibacteriae-4]|jgi:tRNA (guanosine-2'-O-)-methyltransferase|nr:MAG: RNA methyltransferase [Ignavibacteriae bacterium HGW-Ignavibacteriae-4]
MEPTPKRLEKLTEVLRRRQTNLTIILENINDKHNLAACLRSCDAVGVSDVYILYHGTQQERKLGRNAAASATKWLNLHRFYDVEKCFSEIRSKGMKIYTTALGEESVSLYDLDLTDGVALCFGNEHAGVSPEALGLADGNFNIPQAGMIQSLNISVACAVSLYEAYRQRKDAKYYDSLQYPESEFNEKLENWKKK